MYISELTRDQMVELKQNYLMESLMETEGREPSWNELANADQIVSDTLIFDAYAGTDFSPEDFS